MEAIITIVGFLGAGKTTLLEHITTHFTNKGWQPFVILNDYENANIDAYRFSETIAPQWIKALTGNCICCDGINELRNVVNRIPQRTKGITLIEANGTSDACSLMEFLGVGLNEHFLPPVQISVVDTKNWQKRGEHNELEANQVQVSSLIILTHLENSTTARIKHVTSELKQLNPHATILTVKNLNPAFLNSLAPSTNKAKPLGHYKTHWSSCSCDLPTLPNTDCILSICKNLPKSILRVKGCTLIAKSNEYTYFERKPDGEIAIRPFNGIPITGPKLLCIGPNSEVSILQKTILDSINNN